MFVSEVCSHFMSVTTSVLLNGCGALFEGMLTWTLHKNVEQDPSKANVVVEELVKDLEKVCYHCLQWRIYRLLILCAD